MREQVQIFPSGLYYRMEQEYINTFDTKKIMGYKNEIEN